MAPLKTKIFTVCCAGCIALFYATITPLAAADGKKWDGKAYPFKLLNPAKPNSESNPFIIDTAGKLAYLAELAKNNVDMEAFGKKSGLTGLHHAFKDNYAKLTVDLDMNGSRHEFITIGSSAINFDGGGHVITNLVISDRTTPPFINSDTGDAEIYLALFEDAESIKNLGIGKGSSITYTGKSKLTLIVYAAAIAINSYRIENCYSDAVINVKGNGEAVIGGITNTATFLTNSYNRGSITFEGNVISSRSKNRLNKIFPSWLKVGGVCSFIEKNITGCYNTGAITVKASASEALVGGVAAETNRTMCANLYNTGALTVTASGDIKYAAIGGVVGRNVTYPQNPKVRTDGYVDSGYIYNKGNITVLIATGKVICVGGVGGGLYEGGPSASSIEFSGVYGYLNAWNTGTVNVTATGAAELNVGGIAGGSVMIFNCYNTGNISGSAGPGGQLNLGGLGGYAYVQNSYSIGALRGGGAGTNCVGGVIGRAELLWGETDREWYSAHNAFWLRGAPPKGINSDIPYAKGSYFYLRQGDIKKEGLGKLLAVVDKTDPNAMVENSGNGFVYSFDSPRATVMKRSDDGTGKRADVQGTLHSLLNEMVEDKINRLYRRWVIDGSNGGYPVLSSTPTVFVTEAKLPDAAIAQQISGEYAGVHKKWNDTIIFSADGTFKRATGGDGGSWSFDGKRLFLRWKKWPLEILKITSDGSFSSSMYQFTLRRAEAVKPAAVDAGKTVDAKTDDAGLTTAPNAKVVAGTYYAVHRDWSGAFIINADGTFRRDKTDDGGTWTYEKRKLVLTWKSGLVETLILSAAGFDCLAYKFTLRR